ncbi:PREDICTED: lymphocyte antigen 6 complex locus protein G5c isoform X2 [Chinchilla lanigera]|uniref:lymphocyte antigen 6 complex locus protein G5c isoform X2 n=1 Tax=Chinchilla lanigera TaxID=34839 RepID=UPI000699199A|nr:PREDICTED: lymphocyte antigen 6 complex locus protein G5c isoform X2 [Chinchilla lanigera]
MNSELSEHRAMGALRVHVEERMSDLMFVVSGRRTAENGDFCELVHPNPNPPQQPPLRRYLRCYRCLFETKELGCLLGSDICLMPEGSSCITLHIRNASGSDIMVSDCRRREQMDDCTDTRPAPVFGFWIFSHCCFMNFCNDPHNRESYLQ